MKPRTSTGPVGVGLVGAGRMGAAHGRILARQVPEGRLVGIADIDVEAARRLADEVGLGEDRVFATVEALVADPAVEAVLIAASSSRHLEVVRTAAAAGKHILCEKPLALTVEESRAAVEATDAAGVLLQVGLMRRHDPDYRRAAARLRDGTFGRPVLFKSLQFDMEPPPLAFCDPKVSGGIHIDMGIHEFDLARWLMDDEVVEVHAFGSTAAFPEIGATGDVDSAVVNLRLAGGTTGTVEMVRCVAYGEDVRTEVVGTAGSVFVGLLPLTMGASGVRGAIAIDALDPAIPRFERAYTEQSRAFCRAVATGSPVEPDGAAALEALRICLAADRSMREGRPVRLDEIG